MQVAVKLYRRTYFLECLLPLFLNPDYPFIRHFSSKNGK